jgi:hypothetical protein
MPLPHKPDNAPTFPRKIAKPYYYNTRGDRTPAFSRRMNEMQPGRSI